MARRYSPAIDRHQAILPQAAGMFFEIFAQRSTPFEMVGKFAVVSISGPLVQHGPSVWDNYDAIGDRILAALVSPAEAVILRIDSPGGDAPGSFELAKAIRSMAGSKKLIAFTDTCAASAAYAIASAADEIVIAPTAQVGSIGIYQPLVDTTAQDRALGVNYELVISGARKGDGNPHVAVSDGARARVQADVDQLAGIFFATVNELRGMPLEALAALEGSTRIGSRAVEDGLADRVATWAELTTDVAAASITTEVTTMDKAEHVKALRAAAEKEGGEWAKRALKAIEIGSDEEGDEEKVEKKDKEEAGGKKAEDKSEDCKAEEKMDDKKEEKEEKGESSKATLALLKRVHALESAAAKKEEDAARSDLLLKRPDFSEQIRKTLATLPLSAVRDAVENWPQGHGTALAPASAASSHGTVGKGQNVAPRATEADEDEYIARRMGQSMATTGIRHTQGGRTLELGTMTPAQAREHLAKISKGAA